MAIAEQFAGLQMDQLIGGMTECSGGRQCTVGKFHGGLYQESRI